MTNSYYNNITKYLDGKRFNDIYIKGNGEELNKLSKNSEFFFNEKNDLINLYNSIRENYRNDIVFKIELIDQISSVIKSKKDCFIFNEFKISRKLADIAIFNGVNTVFEIKSDIDKAQNIESQFLHYKEVFDYSYLVTSEKKVELLSEKIPKESGILVINDDFQLVTVRKASLHQSQSLETMFKLLRKNEYLELLSHFFGFIPDVPNTKIWDVSLTLLKTVDFKEFKIKFIDIIKRRKSSYPLNALLKVKKELRQGYLSNNLNN